MNDLLLVSAVGDVSFGDHPVCVGHGVASMVRKHGADFLFDSVRPALLSSDVALCNLEGVCSHVGLNRWSLRSSEMRGDPSSVLALKKAGFDLVGVANNHVMQHGLAPFEDMCQSLDLAGIACIGLDGEVGGSRPYIREKNGIQYHFLGFSLHPEEHYTGRPPYSIRDSGEVLLEEVRAYRARTTGPIVISIHWGAEFLDYPSPWQVTLGRALIDAGVSVVFGHHSHVVQHIERYNQGLIFYSLGNFVFDQWAPETKMSLIATVRLRAGVEPEFECQPVMISGSYQPRIATGEEAEQVNAKLSRCQELIDTIARAVSDQEYLVQSKKRRSELRPQTYRHFIRGLPKCPPHLAIQSIVRTASRRFFRE